MASNIKSLYVGGINIQSGNGIPSHLSPKGDLYIDKDIPSQYLSDGDGSWTISSGSTGSTGGTSGITGFTYNSSTNTIVLGVSGITYSVSIDAMSGLTVNGSLSATTYLGLPTDVFVTGGTYTTGTAMFTNNTGGTFSVTGFSTSTGGGETFTGGTITGATNFTDGLTANTISATTYYNLPTDVFVTGGTYSSGVLNIVNSTGGTISINGFMTIGKSYAISNNFTLT